MNNIYVLCMFRNQIPSSEIVGSKSNIQNKKDLDMKDHK